MTFDIYTDNEADKEMLPHVHLMHAHIFNMIIDDVQMKRTNLAFQNDRDIWKTEESISGLDGNVSINKLARMSQNERQIE